MRSTLSVCLFAACMLLAPVAAQSPLTTTFASSTFLSATTGVTVYFDLNVRTGVSIGQMDVNFYGTGGAQARIEVWVRQGTHIGNNTSSAGWSLAGVSNTVTTSPRNTPTPCPFPVPFTLQPGVNGIAVQHFGAGAAYTAGTAVGAVYSSTAEMDFVQGGASNPPIFGGTQNAPRVMNCSIHYQLLGGFASATAYGAGCGGQSLFASYYENFPSGTFDLGGSATAVNSIRHYAAGNQYIVVPGTGAWFTPVSAPLGLGNGAVSAPQPLGFTFTMPNGTPTNDIWICDDGYLWLNGAGIADFTPAVNELLAQGARIAPCWISLNPAVGSIHFDADPANGAAYATWLNVGEQGSGATISMQVALFANGDVEFRYGPETLSTLGATFALVGMSPGGGRLDPGNRNIGSTMPFTLGPDQFQPSLALAASARPVLGTTFNLLTQNVPPNSSLGATVFSFTKYDPGLSLAPLGMPGCLQFCGTDASAVFLPAAGVGTQAVVIPNSPLLTGVRMLAQSAVVAPGSNLLGVVTSNGIELVADVN